MIRGTHEDSGVGLAVVSEDDKIRARHGRRVDLVLSGDRESRRAVLLLQRQSHDQDLERAAEIDERRIQRVSINSDSRKICREDR